MTATAQDIIQTTISYCNIPSVVGFEKPFLDYLAQQFSSLGLWTELNENILIVHGKKPHSYNIAAHVDRHGIVKTGPREYKYAAFVVENKKYSIDYYKSPEFLESIRKEYIDEPVIAYNPATAEMLGAGVIKHLDRESSDDTSVNGDLLFTIDGLDDIPVGTPLSYSIKRSLQQDRFGAQIDNVISVATIRHLFRDGYEGTAFFTTEEEIGQSWSFLHRYYTHHQLTIPSLYTLDTCPFDETGPMDRGEVILRHKDALGIFEQTLTNNLAQACTDIDIPYLFADEYIHEQNKQLLAEGKPTIGLGITELGQLIKNTKGFQGGTSIQIPTTGYHTNHETTSITCIENMYNLLTHVLIDTPTDRYAIHNHTNQPFSSDNPNRGAEPDIPPLITTDINEFNEFSGLDQQHQLTSTPTA